MVEQNYFTIDDANRVIPWLEERLQSMTSLNETIGRLRSDLGTLVQKRTSNGHGDTDEEVMSNYKETDVATNKLRSLVKEISDAGIILRNIERGLIDFPSVREGREVYLCWVWGEPSIQFWHEINTGFLGRQALE